MKLLGATALMLIIALNLHTAIVAHSQGDYKARHPDFLEGPLRPSDLLSIVPHIVVSRGELQCFLEALAVRIIAVAFSDEGRDDPQSIAKLRVAIETFIILDRIAFYLEKKDQALIELYQARLLAEARDMMGIAEAREEVSIVCGPGLSLRTSLVDAVIMVATSRPLDEGLEEWVIPVAGAYSLYQDFYGVATSMEADQGLADPIAGDLVEGLDDADVDPLKERKGLGEEPGGSEEVGGSSSPTDLDNGIEEIINDIISRLRGAGGYSYAAYDSGATRGTYAYPADYEPVYVGTYEKLAYALNILNRGFSLLSDIEGYNITYPAVPGESFELGYDGANDSPSLLWAPILAALLLVGVIAKDGVQRLYRARYLNRIADEDPAAAAILCYNELLKIVEGLGAAKRYSESPREYLARAYKELGNRDLLSLLEEATMLYERVKYGGLEPGVGEVKACIRRISRPWL